MTDTDDFEFDLGNTEDEETASLDSLTVLDRLKETLQQEVMRPLIQIALPGHEGIGLRFDPNFTRKDAINWNRNAGGQSRKGVDEIKFACYVVGNCLTGIYQNGELVTNADGIALTFASKEILDSVDEDRPVPEGIQAFFGNDGALLRIAAEIIDHSGFSVDIDAEEVDEEDPTRP